MGMESSSSSSDTNVHGCEAPPLPTSKFFGVDWHGCWSAAQCTLDCRCDGLPCKQRAPLTDTSMNGRLEVPVLVPGPKHGWLEAAHRAWQGRSMYCPRHYAAQTCWWAVQLVPAQDLICVWFLGGLLCLHAGLGLLPLQEALKPWARWAYTEGSCRLAMRHFRIRLMAETLLAREMSTQKNYGDGPFRRPHVSEDTGEHRGT